MYTIVSQVIVYSEHWFCVCLVVTVLGHLVNRVAWKLFVVKSLVLSFGGWLLQNERVVLTICSSGSAPVVSKGYYTCTC